jgi:hypothetical protein
MAKPSNSEDPVRTVLYVYDKYCRDNANVTTRANPERQVVKQSARDSVVGHRRRSRGAALTEQE